MKIYVHAGANQPAMAGMIFPIEYVSGAIEDIYYRHELRTTLINGAPCGIEWCIPPWLKQHGITRMIVESGTGLYECAVEDFLEYAHVGHDHGRELMYLYETYWQKGGGIWFDIPDQHPLDSVTLR